MTRKQKLPKGRNTKEILAIFSKIASVISYQSIDQILLGVISEIAALLDTAGCSIYLIPEILPLVDDVLMRGDQIFSYTEMDEEVIVLAATTHSAHQRNVGKSFYRKGEGLTGWVYLHGIPLNIRNIEDKQELAMIAPDLKWGNISGDSFSYYMEKDKKPMLLVPLRANGLVLGVIKFYAKKMRGVFNDLDENLAFLVAKLITTSINYASDLISKKVTIQDLININSQNSLDSVLINTTSTLRNILRAEKCRVYLFNTDENSTIRMVAENGTAVSSESTHKRSKDLIGWVYKTGKPLIIEDVRPYRDIQYLEDEDLERISDGALVNEDDRELLCSSFCRSVPQNLPITFLAVPIKQDWDVLGVISAYSRHGASFRRRTSFNRDELTLLQSFSVMVTNAIEADQEKKLSKLLIELGYSSNPEELFQLIISEVPKLISSAGCSIFEYKRGVQGPFLQLVKTSRRGLIRNNEAVSLNYPLGFGKTGFCAEARATLVVNHFGFGTASEEALEAELERIRSGHRNIDLIDRLIDKNGLQVGVIQLRRGVDLDKAHHLKFKQLSKKQIIGPHGLPSSNLASYYSKEMKPYWSFAAIPIRSSEKNVWGVVTVGRTVPNNPISARDITVVESVAGRLATVLDNLKLEEQRGELFMSLAHELNTPITGMLADSENLMLELKNDTELCELARNNLEQVLRLHMLTETIMGVISDELSEKEFEFHSIEKILRTARNMFEAEAAYKGCNIKEPQAVEGNFPLIEFYEFELLLAIKNIVHNAVKYSFAPGKDQEEKRYVKIWGGYADREKKIYKISVQNYGVGISEEEIEKRYIFDKSYRGIKANDRRRTGAGFGLAYAKRIIEDMHGGYIEVSSINQGGDAYLTTFTIYLPVHQQDKKLVQALILERIRR